MPTLSKADRPPPRRSTRRSTAQTSNGSDVKDLTSDPVVDELSERTSRTRRQRRTRSSSEDAKRIQANSSDQVEKTNVAQDTKQRTPESRRRARKQSPSAEEATYATKTDNTDGSTKSRRRTRSLSAGKDEEQSVLKRDSEEINAATNKKSKPPDSTEEIPVENKSPRKPRGTPAGKKTAGKAKSPTKSRSAAREKEIDSAVSDSHVEESNKAEDTQQHSITISPSSNKSQSPTPSKKMRPHEFNDKGGKPSDADDEGKRQSTPVEKQSARNKSYKENHILYPKTNKGPSEAAQLKSPGNEAQKSTSKNNGKNKTNETNTPLSATELEDNPKIDETKQQSLGDEMKKLTTTKTGKKKPMKSNILKSDTEVGEDPKSEGAEQQSPDKKEEKPKPKKAERSKSKKSTAPKSGSKVEGDPKEETKSSTKKAPKKKTQKPAAYPVKKTPPDEQAPKKSTDASSNGIKKDGKQTSSKKSKLKSNGKKSTDENTKKRKGDKTESGTSSKKAKKSSTDESFTCPHCLKALTSEKRFKNHLEKCKTLRRNSAPSSINSSSEASTTGKLVKTAKPSSTDINVTTPGLVCAYCTKSFLHESTYQYHIRNKVCMEENKFSLYGKQNKAPFEQLEPGSRFVTKFGVVEVIADDRLPPKHHEKVITQNSLKRCRAIARNREKFNTKKHGVIHNISAGTRRRRKELNQMYMETRNEDSAGGISQERVWSLYCKSLTPAQILDERLSWPCKNQDLLESVKVDKFDPPHPLEPDDSYPDRIVECKLIVDRRSIMTSKHDSGEADDKTEKNDTVIASNHATESTPKKQKSGQKIRPTMRLYLKRRELSRPYNRLQKKYVCSDCGKDFISLPKWRIHHQNKACSLIRIESQMKRKEEIESIEETAGSGNNNEKFLRMIHAPVTPKLTVEKVTTTGATVDVEWGNPHKVKEHKKHRWPPWMVFSKERSSIYPEVFISLGFKRGANNTKFFQKQAMEEGYINAHERHRARKTARKKKKRMEQVSSKKPSLSALSKTPRETSSPQIGAMNENVTVPPLELGVPAGPENPVPNEPLPQLPAPTLRLPLPQLPTPVTEMPLQQLLALTQQIPVQQIPAATAQLPTHQAPMPFGAYPALFRFDNMLVSGMNGVITSAAAPALNDTARPNGSPNTTVSGADKATYQPTPEKTRAEEAAAAVAHHKDIVATLKARETEKNDADERHNAKPTSSARKRRKRRSNPSEHGLGQLNGGKSVTLEDMNLKPKKPAVVVDTQALAEECEAGRYPSVNRFHGDHEGTCVLCTDDVETPERENPLIDCDFCKNTVHQFCIDKRMLQKDPPVIIRESEPDDSLMCHDCIALCLARRARAETRRLSKWHHELSKAGLDQNSGGPPPIKRRRRGPEAASLPVEVDLNELEETNEEDPEASAEDDDAPTYKPCPRGGPGGLICCSRCTAVYSRKLSNTAKEIEAQSVAKSGQEVSEILELLADAKKRLRNQTDVSHSNNFRRSMFRNNESASKKLTKNQSALGLHLLTARRLSTQGEAGEMV